MKKILLILTLILILTACVNNSTSVVFGDDWGIDFSLKDVTSGSATLVFNQKDGNAKGELQTGAEFSIEKYENGNWKAVPTNPLIDYAWHMVAYQIKKNDVTEFECEWKWLYGELENGHYRLNKKVIDFVKTGEFEEKTYSVEFIIDEEK